MYNFSDVTNAYTPMNYKILFFKLKSCFQATTPEATADELALVSSGKGTSLSNTS